MIFTRKLTAAAARLVYRVHEVTRVQKYSTVVFMNETVPQLWTSSPAHTNPDGSISNPAEENHPHPLHHYRLCSQSSETEPVSSGPKTQTEELMFSLPYL